MKKHMQPHIMCGVGDVAKYVLIPGDPKRVEKIAAFFDESKKVADYRGFVTYTGTVNGIGISACSTGIGCPSAAIAVEELSRIGAETFIRVGTTGALQTRNKDGRHRHCHMRLYGRMEHQEIMHQSSCLQSQISTLPQHSLTQRIN